MIVIVRFVKSQFIERVQSEIESVIHVVPKCTKVIQKRVIESQRVNVFYYRNVIDLISLLVLITRMCVHLVVSRRWSTLNSLEGHWISKSIQSTGVSLVSAAFRRENRNHTHAHTISSPHAYVFPERSDSAFLSFISTSSVECYLVGPRHESSCSSTGTLTDA